MKAIKYFFLVFSCAAGFLFAPPPRPCRAENAKPNIILISLNALRADHLGIYGYAKETAPNLSRLAREAAVFDRAIAQSHWTLPSLASLFTSKYVHSHGLYERGGRLSEKEFTLAEALKEGSYETAAFTGGLDTSGVFGLQQGFDVYSDDTGRKPMGSFRESMPKALNWLSARRGGRFFLFLGSYDIHPPFDKPGVGGASSGYSGVLKERKLNYALLNTFREGALTAGGAKIVLAKADLDYIGSCYDNGIAYADKFLGELQDRLAELGLSSGTAIIVTAEHGEELGDHGSFDRFGSGNLYDEVIRVPLIIKLPGKDLKGVRVSGQAQLIDLMPTVLALAGLRVPGTAQGRSLLTLLEGGEGAGGGEALNNYAYSEAGPHKWAVRSAERKLIYEKGSYALFDLVNDSAESRNIAESDPAAVYKLAQELMEWRRRTKTLSSPNDTKAALTGEMKRKLREAGYWK